MGLSRISHWIWPGSSKTRRIRESPPATIPAMSGGLFPDSPSGFREPETPRAPSSGRRGRDEEAMVDREHDMVIVPADGGGYISDSGSDDSDSDWSIGWLEPQGPELHSDGDSEGSFAVLVPCYRRGRRVEDPRRGRLAADGNVSDGRNSVARWLSSTPN
uniref:Uncharacterized protein n=1 Tax=Leersia perrieri TaxID=77586 RepID=A0A0D9X7T2_9ORYZ